MAKNIFMLYTRLLLLFLISCLFLNTKAQTTNGLVAYYPFSGNATDKASTHDGVVNGATLIADRFGTANSAYHFDGNQWIQVPHSTKLNFTTEFTISLWIKPTGSGRTPDNTAPTIINKECEYEISRWQDNSIRWATNTAYVWHDTKIIAPLNEWKQIIMVYGAGKVIFYENGKKVYEYNKPINGSIFPTTKPLTIGSRPGGTWNGFDCYGRSYDQNFQGAIDDIRIYKFALTESETKQLYEQERVISNPKIDLALTSSTKNFVVQKDSIRVVSFKLKNESTTTATNIKVLLKIPYTPPFVIKNSQNCSRGTFDSNMWTIPALAAGDSCVLNINYQPTQSGVWYIEGEVFASDQEDLDSKTNNSIDTEDDFARICLSIPIKSTSETFGMQLMIEDSKIDILQWYRDGIIIAGENQKTLQVKALGKYSYTTKTYKCPTQGCCPFIIEKSTAPINCCTPLEYILNKQN
ncbi:MAG: LamG domain-containing protein [Emticicia sp.]|uniref:LamG domain-containing protein n=1 Tax=Emticicia sp. TaxID=1930953 RepID=UPI003BA61FE0